MRKLRYPPFQLDNSDRGLCKFPFVCCYKENCNIPLVLTRDAFANRANAKLCNK